MCDKASPSVDPSTLIISRKTETQEGTWKIGRGKTIKDSSLPCGKVTFGEKGEITIGGDSDDDDGWKLHVKRNKSSTGSPKKSKKKPAGADIAVAVVNHALAAADTTKVPNVVPFNTPIGIDVVLAEGKV